eukprot:TRINITY_DN16290_c0_g1_i1.p1 TRINITY_DN16290_c0_g1~~TRINITY_DN16290_c0_g1_i1.p1  ORF type:complete len:271 (-),score=41.11 TRINITY_DN16290_c0_g1_i1:196-1008(-)
MFGQDRWARSFGGMGGFQRKWSQAVPDFCEPVSSMANSEHTIPTTGPNGPVAAAKLHETNKSDPRVVTLPSGLQYRVLREGRGMAHPTASALCECHYAGKLLDGTEFDSTYARGKPSAFTPNQAIKGWSEAMQLMVEGDKWVLYMPQKLASGGDGRPPKIPPAACLIFTIEIVNITGESVSVEFPEWTEEQLKLWEKKDEAQITKWVEAKEREWAEGTLKEKYSTREEFEEWLKAQSKKAKDKSLWKRTRKNYELETGRARLGKDVPSSS